MGKSPPVLDFKVGLRLRRAWRKMGEELRPAKPRQLLAQLWEVHHYPHDGLHLPTRWETHEQRNAIAGAYNEFVLAGRRLLKTLISITPHWYLFRKDIFPDLTASQIAKLKLLEIYLPRIEKLPILQGAKRKPGKIKDNYAEAIALVVCFYFRFDEKTAMIRDEEHRGELVRREGLIYQETMRALGHTGNGTLQTRFKSARKRIRALKSEENWLEILSEVGFALRQ